MVRTISKKELKKKIKIPVTDVAAEQPLSPATQAFENRTLTLKEKYDKTQKLAALGYTKTRICKGLNMDVRIYKKLLSASPEKLDMRFDSRRRTSPPIYGTMFLNGKNTKNTVAIMKTLLMSTNSFWNASTFSSCSTTLYRR